MRSLEVTSLTDALANSVRDRIFGGDIGPGTVLTEAVLTSEYEVARPTAKAAIERLVTEGILERAAHRSARVPVMDVARVNDLYFTRSILESQAYRQLARRRLVPGEAEEAMTELASATESGDLGRLVRSDIAFHRALVGGLDSDLLSKVHDSLINEMRLCLAQVQTSRLLPPDQIAVEHAAIMKGIRGGSPDDAEAAGNYHLEHARSLLVDHLTRRDQRSSS